MRPRSPLPTSLLRTEQISSAHAHIQFWAARADLTGKHDDAGCVPGKGGYHKPPLPCVDAPQEYQRLSRTRIFPYSVLKEVLFWFGLYCTAPVSVLLDHAAALEDPRPRPGLISRRFQKLSGITSLDFYVSFPSSASACLITWMAPFLAGVNELFASDIHAEIRIQNHYKFRVYSPGEQIIGVAIVTIHHDAAFDGIDISLTGVAVTHNYVQPDPVQATHPFIKLRAPCDFAASPSGPNVFRAGVQYTFPFRFTIPRTLPARSCRHRCIAPSLRERHLRLPPTMGFCPGNDGSPEAARISYGVEFVAYRRYSLLHAPGLLFRVTQQVRVLSSCQEEPALDCLQATRMYKPSASKRFWQSVFMGTGGELKVEASQPRAIVLSPDGTTASESSVHLRLAFIPSLAELPPVKLQSASGKLTSNTYFHVAPINHAPALEPPARHELRPYFYKTRHKLFHQSLERVQWESNALNDTLVQLRNHVSNPDHTAQAGHGRGRRASLPWAWKHRQEPSVMYTADVDIPFALPGIKGVVYLPSFDSCLVSRTYAVNVTVRAGSVLGWVTLSVPIQIVVDGGPQGTLGTSSEGASIGLLEAGVEEDLPPYVAQLADSGHATPDVPPSYG